MVRIIKRDSRIRDSMIETKKLLAPAVIAVVIIVIVIFATQQNSAASDPKKYMHNGIYYNPEIGLKFNYPEGWEIYPNVGEDDLLTLIKRYKNSKEMITFGSYEKEKYGIHGNVNLTDFQKTLIETVKGKSFIEFKNSSIIKIKNRDWLLMNFFDTRYKTFTTDYFTMLPFYIFFISHVSPLNINHNFLNLTPIMESLECGEVKNP
jgi:hypothetical protein